MAKLTATKTEDLKDTENDSLKNDCEESSKTGYTIKEATEILIQRVIERWRIKNMDSNSATNPEKQK
jgi:hypothetical protein